MEKKDSGKIINNMIISKSRFQLLVSIGFVLQILGAIFGVIGKSSLPPELQTYVNQYYENDLSIAFWLLFGISVIAIVSNIGIFFFAKWAKNIFTISYLLSCAGMFLNAPIVQTGIASTFIELSIFCAGFIVACMYLTPIKDLFIERDNGIIYEKR